MKNEHKINQIFTELRRREILIGGEEVTFSEVPPLQLVPEVIQFVQSKWDILLKKEEIEKVYANEKTVTIVFNTRIFGEENILINHCPNY